MLRLLKRKWWVTLIQGILLVIFSIYIFMNPVAILASISFWVGLVVLISGSIGIIAWIIAPKEERENINLFLSIITTIVGIVMLTHIFTMMKLVTVVFGAWMVLAGLAVFWSGWGAKKEHSLGWGAVITGFLAALGGTAMILNFSAGAIGISTWLGISVLFTGVAIILLALIKKRAINVVRGAVADVKAGA
ncbi:MAG TPA: DUF308 domain-containing protein [Saprospiraceae bacterium]|nr:DUF308 domain-containing protein [Saprospiraceae bacterium]